MSSTSKERSEFEFTGKHMAMIMVAFFGVIITVNFTMARLASTSWTGLVVKNSYVASQHFNDELLQAQAQREAGLFSDLAYQNGTLTFAMKDKTGATLAASNLIAEIGRPAFEQADTVVAFAKAEGNQHQLSLGLEPGVWAVTITGTSNGFEYRRDARIFVSEDGNGRLE